jgi:L-fuconolactonase
MHIDSHQHFWRYDAAQYAWITDEMASLRRDFLPEDLSPLLKAAGFAGTVAVQARPTLAETDWLLSLANRHDFIQGVVGWVDLCAADVGSQLQQYAEHPKFKGVRHLVEDEPDVDFILRPEFHRGIRALTDLGLTYDLLIRPGHLPAALKLVQEHPRQYFVVDHIAKPSIKDRIFLPWQADLESLARFDNVYCKLSGMVTRAHWQRWKLEEFTPYMDIVFDAFGMDRIMVGSDWPVCTPVADYGSTIGVVEDYIQRFSPEVREQVLGGNCASFYRL